MEKFWHYTTQERLEQILEDGVLLPTTYAPPDNFTRTLWFSTNQHYEQTARKRVAGTATRLTMEEMHVLLGLARIGAPDDLVFLHFRSWAYVVGVPGQTRSSFVNGGIELGANPGDWYASFEALPKERWATIELWNGKEWRSR